MRSTPICPECGTIWMDEKTCQDHFNQMLYWEAENPHYGEVHHLMVLCYHLQHPSLYSLEGLEYSIQLLKDFLEGGVPPGEMRKRIRTKVDSGTRKWKVKATAGSQGAYKNPIQWQITAGDVVAGGSNHYCENIREWAQEVLITLKAAGYGYS